MKAFLFDVDGVLFDSVTSNYPLYYAVLSERGLPTPTREQVVDCTGSVAPDWFKEIGVKLTPDLRSEITRRYADEFFPKYAKPNPEAFPVLEALRKKKALIGVVTNQTRAQAEVILPKLGFEFDCVATMSDGEPKPAPDLLYKAIHDLKVEKSEAIFIGDALPDENAAKSAGVDYRILARPYNAKLKNRIQSLRDLLDIE